MNMLSIGGSDPSSGAGIQRDVKTAMSLGAHCCTIITAITSQNTSKYVTSSPVSVKTIRHQFESILSDFEIDVIKIAMVYDSKTIHTIHDLLKSLSVPIIVDPVIQSTTGGTLLKKDALTDYRKQIISLAHVITPNLVESEIISGIKLHKKSDIEKIMTKITGMGAKNIIITGIEENGKIADFVKTKQGICKVVGQKIKTQNHGSGCTYATALAVSIFRKGDILKSAKNAQEFTIRAIIGAKKIGRGVKITNQTPDDIRKKLSSGIAKFIQIKNISSVIPECQTNFVFAKNNPESVGDILGLSGRIVKAGDGLIVAGELEYGGSKHVANAVLLVNKKFPKVRAAVNIKYDPKILTLLKNQKMKIQNYDRNQEPEKIKGTENMTIKWGVQSAISHSTTAPDVIFHTGDIGKEPMILVFGSTPQNVIKKIAGIF